MSAEQKKIADGISEYKKTYGSNPYGLQFTPPYPTNMKDFQEERDAFIKLIERKLIQQAREMGIWALEKPEELVIHPKPKAEKKMEKIEKKTKKQEKKKVQKITKPQVEQETDVPVADLEDYGDTPVVVDESPIQNGKSHFIVDPYPLTDSTLPGIAEFLHDLITQMKEAYDDTMAVENYQLNIIVQFLSDVNTESSIFDGITFTNNPLKQEAPKVPTLDLIKETLQKVLNQHYKGDYIAYLCKVKFHAIKPQMMGCEGDRNYQHVMIRGKKCELISYKTTKGNNCSFILFHKHFKQPQATSCLLAERSNTQPENTPVKPNAIRKALGIDEGVLITVKQLEKIYKYYQQHYTNEEIKGYVVFNEQYKLLGGSTTNKDITGVGTGIIIIVLINDHCYELRYPGAKPSSISCELTSRAYAKKLKSLEAMKVELKEETAEEDQSEEESEESEEEEEEEEEKEEVLVIAPKPNVMLVSKPVLRASERTQREPTKFRTAKSKVQEKSETIKAQKFKQCKDCGRKYLFIHESCNPRMTNYYQQKILGNDKRVVEPARQKYAVNTKYQDNVVFILSKSVLDEDGKEKKVSEFSILDTTNNYKLIVDLEYAVSYILTKKDVTLVSYGSQTFILLLQELAKRDVEQFGLIKKEGTDIIIKFNFGDNIHARNLCFFLQDYSSFETVCAKMTLEPSPDDVDKLHSIYKWTDKTVYDATGYHISGFLTINQLLYAYWMRITNNLNKEIPNEKDFQFEKRAYYSAMNYPLVHKYESHHYSELVARKGEYIDGIYKKIKESGDYRVSLDVSSCYPASMRGNDFCMVKYGVGYGRRSEEGEKEYKKGKIGFYKISYITDKTKRIPLLPRKAGYSDIWDLNDSEGVYTSVDIQNAIEFGGYQITFLGECLVWDKTSSDVFAEFVDKFYKLKSSYAKGSVEYATAKVGLNGLYGNMAKSSNRRTVATTVKNVNEEISFRASHKDVSNLGDSDEDEAEFKEKKLYGRVEELSERNRPFAYAPFILSYSRRIMFSHLQVIDPNFTTTTFSNITNDAVRISGQAYESLQKAGRVKSELGYLTNDLPSNGIIVREINLDVNRSLVEYVTADDEICVQERGLIKLSGCKSELQSYKFFESKESETVSWKKDQCVSEQQNGVWKFTVKEIENTWTYRSLFYEKMDYADNEWKPKVQKE